MGRGPGVDGDDLELDPDRAAVLARQEDVPDIGFPAAEGLADALALEGGDLRLEEERGGAALKLVRRVAGEAGEGGIDEGDAARFGIVIVPGIGG